MSDVTGPGRLKRGLKAALSETNLGSGLLVDEATLDAAVDHLVQYVRDIKASALTSMAWQLPPKVGDAETREATKRHLLKAAEGVKAGTWWEE